MTAKRKPQTGLPAGSVGRANRGVVQIALECTPEERETIKRLARESQLTVSQFVLRAVRIQSSPAFD